MQAKEIAKAIVGSATAGVTAAGTALADGQITAVEWCGIVVAVLAVFGAVFGVPNAQPAGKQYDAEHAA